MSRNVWYPRENSGQYTKIQDDYLCNQQVLSFVRCAFVEIAVTVCTANVNGLPKCDMKVDLISWDTTCYTGRQPSKQVGMNSVCKGRVHMTTAECSVEGIAGQPDTFSVTEFSRVNNGNKIFHQIDLQILDLSLTVLVMILKTKCYLFFK